MINADIEALEGHDMEKYNTPRAYLNSEIGKRVLVKFMGQLVELLVLTNPEVCLKHVVMDNYKKFLYVKLWKAIYRFLYIPVLFYRLLLVDLIGIF